MDITPMIKYVKSTRRANGWKALFTLSIVLSMHVGAVAQATISRGFVAEQEVAQGSLISQVPGTNQVVIATQANEEYLAGVVNQENSALLEIVAVNETVQVAESGKVEVLVTNLDGAIEAGDYVGVSRIEGIASKASSQSNIVGVALEAFNGEDDTQVIRDITQEVDTVVDPNLISGPVALGKITVEIGIQNNPLQAGGGFADNVNEKLGEIGISPTRFAIAALLFVSGISMIAALMYGAIKSTIISLGRNPMGRKLIYGGLVQVFALTGIILLGTLVALYLVLTL